MMRPFNLLPALVMYSVNRYWFLEPDREKALKNHQYSIFKWPGRQTMFILVCVQFISRVRFRVVTEENHDFRVSDSITKYTKPNFLLDCVFDA